MIHFGINFSDTKSSVKFNNNIQINSEINSGELTEHYQSEGLAQGPYVAARGRP